MLYSIHAGTPVNNAPHFKTAGFNAVRSDESDSKEEKMKTAKSINTRKLVLLALLTAIVVVLQVLAILMRPLFPTFTISLVLVPIVIGAALIGVYSGGWLGLAFGIAVLISGDAALFLAVNPFGTILVVLLKGLLAGLASGAVYKLFAERNKTLAAIGAAIVCPIVNTGIFIAGCYVFFLETLTQWAGDGNVTTFIFIGMAGVNFLVELGINLVLSPTIVRLIQFGQDKREVVMPNIAMR